MATLDYGRSRLPELLEARHMTQAEFARKLGVSDSFVSKVISGVSRFSVLSAIEATEILHCDIHDLYEWVRS
jgi:transcriptional regulator with XRE-family HTH domain